MEVFKCRICGDPYVGAARPSHCPFCGAPETYIIPARDWQEEETVELSEVSAANLEHALMIENNNALFYTCAYEVAMDAEIESAFKALARVEAEHASIVRKMLGLPKPAEEEDNRGRCHALEQANVNEALDREKRAIDFYARAAEVAIEPRVKEIFAALVEIETTHIEVVEKVMRAFTSTAEGSIL